MQSVGPQFAVPVDLVRPVDQDAGRTYHEEMPSAFDVEVAHGGQGLHALAQAHLVAKHCPFLTEREFCAERLVPAQGCAHEREVERVLVDAPCYLGRDEPLSGLDVGREFADLDEQPVVEDGTGLVVLPQAGIIRRSRGKCREARLEPRVQARLTHGPHQVFELAEIAPGLFALTRAGKEHPQAAGRASRPGEDSIERRGHFIEVLVTRRGRLARHPVCVEFSQQPGLQRRAGVGVEAQPDALHHRAAELTGRGYDLSCSLGTDPRYLLEPCYSGGCRLADGTVASGLDEPQPEPALSGLLEPRQRKLGQLLAHNIISRHLVRGPGAAEPDGRRGDHCRKCRS